MNAEPTRAADGPPRRSVRQRCELRARVLRAVRQFFERADFCEVDTAVALRAPAPELYIDAVPVALRHGEATEQRFLQTSPELPMKRLVAAGLPRIFQVAAAFRDGERGPRHRPEFRLLEWYRADAPWTALLDDCEALLRAAADAADVGPSPTYQGAPVDLTPPFVRLTVDAAFRQHVGLSILEFGEPEPLRTALAAVGIACAADDTWDDMFHRAFVARIDPVLAAAARPVFLTHYPMQLAALARPSADDPRAAERFELFVRGLELANGFGELTCATQQRQRFVAERQRRRRAGRLDYPLDEPFLAALATLPPTSGIALGLERLLMVLFDAADIDGVSCLPWGAS